MINSDTRLIPDGFDFLDPFEELSILGNMLFRSNASVTFATVVVRFICLRFSQRFFRHRRRL